MMMGCWLLAPLIQKQMEYNGSRIKEGGLHYLQFYAHSLLPLSFNTLLLAGGIISTKLKYEALNKTF